MAMVAAFFRKEVLPWYFLWVMPFVAFSYDLKQVLIFSGATSLGLVLRYAPFIFFGDYRNETNIWRNWVFALPIMLTFIYLIIRNFSGNNRQHLPK
jgi:hypothetical protein